MRFIVFVNFLIITKMLFAQKTVTKEIVFLGETIFVSLENIDQLELKHTNDAKIIVTSSEQIDEVSFFTIQTNRTEAVIKNTKAKTKRISNACIEAPLLSSYVIYIPEKLQVNITIHNGNFKTTFFSGSLNLEVDSGEIELNNFNGIVKIKNINGNIFCNFKEGELIINNHLGKTNCTLKSKNLKKSSQNINGFLQNRKNHLEIETIQGNIYIKSIETL